MSSSVHSSGPIQLDRMSKLLEARGAEDDWSGVADAAARRRMQTRLNMRAMRRRRAEQSRVEDQSQESTQHLETSQPSYAQASDEVAMFSKDVPCWDEGGQAVLHFSPLKASRVLAKKGTGRPSNTAGMFPYLSPSRQTQSSRARTIILPLSSDHLIPLLQYNTLRAMLTNMQLLRRLAGSAGGPGCTADLLRLLLPPSSTTMATGIPPSLVPTQLQLSIPHSEWLDAIPHPRWRDNLLLSLGAFDEGELRSDTVGGLFQGLPHTEVRARGVIAWYPPWHVSGWELSEGFWRKWRWSFVGCEDALEATNRWRARRGEDPLVFEIE
ncbi:DUF3425 domain-containing protein [Microdochium nivale]|nr:DUF3425 domain-containing protein [Microdochium nivale]